MRSLKGTLPNRNYEINRAGKISLVILLTILTFLLYGKADAKENELREIFARNDALWDVDVLSRANEQDIATKDLSQETTQERIKREQVLTLDFMEVKNTKKELSIKKKLTPVQIAQVREEARQKMQIDTQIDPKLKEDVSKELKGTRMEPMIDYISMKDRELAGLIVGIAKIESGYTHNYSYNFWGYAGGYYPFSSPEQAVDVVSKRIGQLRDQGLNTPSKIVTTWKCGSSCASHAPGSVQRWVATANGPFGRITLN